jgi:hypothetical protein
MNPSPTPAPVAENPIGRDAAGRFAKGNPGGPGNPYYRRQAELKRLMLESVTDTDVLSVMQVLLGLARGGDLVAIKLFLEYTVGKPSKEVDPDKEELHEWQLQQQTPRLVQVMETMTHSIETPRANQVVRDMVPIVGSCHLKTLSQHLRQGTDYEGRQIAPPLEEVQPPADPNGDKRPSASARRMAAGVGPTVQSWDNGKWDEAAWNQWLDEEAVRAVQTGEIGTPGARQRPGGPTARGYPGATEPGKR